MAFCGKCGKPVQDGAAFCAACGNPMNADSAQKTAKPKVNTGSVVKLPKSISGWISIGLMVLSFIFMFLNWGSYSVKSYGMKLTVNANIFEASGMGMKASTFDIHTCLGIANIFGIIVIVAFVVYLVGKLLNIGGLVPALANFDFEKCGKIVYLLCYALAIILGFIGVIASGGLKLTVGFFVALVFYILAVIGTNEKLVSKIVPAK